MGNEKHITFSVRLPKPLQKQAARRAKALNRSLNQHIAHLLGLDIQESKRVEVQNEASQPNGTAAIAA